MLSSVVKRGRHTAVYTAANGDQIVGLMRLKDRRWRASGPEKYTFSEPDEKLAIAHFRQWQALKDGDGLVRIPVLIASSTKRATNNQVNAVLAPRVMTEGFDEEAVTTRAAFPDAIWAWVRQEILTRPKYVAQMTGIEQIGYLHDLKPPKPSPTLEDVGKAYLDHAKISANWRAKSKIFWSEFTALVEVTTLRELTQEHVVDYADMVREAAKAPTYARQRFGAIKAIINYPTKRGKWAEDCKRVLAFCAVLVPPRKSAVDPHPISREDFAKLLKAVSPQPNVSKPAKNQAGKAEAAVTVDLPMRAMLLLMLNACMYGGEVAVLNWSELDLAKGLLVAQRPKTGVVRVAALWPRTIEALKALDRGKTDAVFTTEIGSQADYLHVYRRFKVCREAAGVPHVQLSHIRDGAFTAAAEALPTGVGLDMCRLLAGQACGVADHYIKRNPKMVASACEAVEKAYFG